VTRTREQKICAVFVWAGFDDMRDRQRSGPRSRD
jgi:hypothetical protein